MEHFFGIFKKHPALIIGAVAIGAVIIFVIASRSNVSAGTTTGGNATDDYMAMQQINAQLAMTQDALSAQTNQSQFAYQGKLADDQTNTNLASIASNTSLQGAAINANYGLAMQGMTNQASALVTLTNASVTSEQNNLLAGLNSEQMQYQAVNQAAQNAAAMALPVAWSGYYGAAYDEDFTQTAQALQGIYTTSGGYQSPGGTYTPRTYGGSATGGVAGTNASLQAYAQQTSDLLKSFSQTVGSNPTATPSSTSGMTATGINSPNLLDQLHNIGTPAASR